MTDESECADLPDVPSAKSVRVHVCNHGTVTLIMLDGAAQPIAVAYFNLGAWAAVTEDAINQIETNCPDMIVGYTAVETVAGQAETDDIAIAPTATKH